MNRLEITGKILYDPQYIEGAPRIIRMTIKAIDREHDPEMYLKLECEWKSPPNRYWQHPDLEIGTLVRVHGPLYTAPSTLDGPTKSRGSYLDIRFFEIRTTRADFERMKQRGVEKDRKDDKKF
jgi:hypothetical protein